MFERGRFWTACLGWEYLERASIMFSGMWFLLNLLSKILSLMFLYFKVIRFFFFAVGEWWRCMGKYDYVKYLLYRKGLVFLGEEKCLSLSGNRKHTEEFQISHLINCLKAWGQNLGLPVLRSILETRLSNSRFTNEGAGDRLSESRFLTVEL